MILVVLHLKHILHKTWLMRTMHIFHLSFLLINIMLWSCHCGANFLNESKCTSFIFIKLCWCAHLPLFPHPQAFDVLGLIWFDVMLCLLVFKVSKHPYSSLHKLRQFLAKIFISSTNFQLKRNIQLRTFYAIYINLSIRPYVISSNNTRWH